MRLTNRHLQIQHTNVQLSRHIATNLHPAMRICISAPRCPIVALSQHLQHRTCLAVTRPAACSAHVASLPTPALPRLNAPQQSTSANSTHQRPTQLSYRHQPAPSHAYMHLRASLPQLLPHCCAFAAFAAQDLCVRHTTAACSAHVASLPSSALPRLNAPQQSTSANSTHQRPTLLSYRHQPAPSHAYMLAAPVAAPVAAPFLRFRSICST